MALALQRRANVSSPKQLAFHLHRFNYTTNYPNENWATKQNNRSWKDSPKLSELFGDNAVEFRLVNQTFQTPPLFSFGGTYIRVTINHDNNFACILVTDIPLIIRQHIVRLPPEVNRVLYIRNLPYKISAEEMYDIFGKYGAIRQIRVGNTPESRGTAFVVYEDIFDAKNACDHLSGFNVCNRYLVVLYYRSNKAFKGMDIDKKQEELDTLKKKYGISTEELRK